MVQEIQEVQRDLVIQEDQPVLYCLVDLEILYLQAVPEDLLDLAILGNQPLDQVVLSVRLVLDHLESQEVPMVQKVQVDHWGLKALEAQGPQVHPMVLEILYLLEALKVQSARLAQHYQGVQLSQRAQSDLEVQMDPKDRVVQTDQEVRSHLELRMARVGPLVLQDPFLLEVH